MTIPPIVGVGNVAAGTGDVVPTLPAGWQVNDIAWLVVEQSAVNAWGTAPTGYTVVPNCQQEAGTAATDGNITVYWRRLQAGDTDPTVPDTINHTSARIIVTRGSPTTGDPWNVTNGGTDTVSDTNVSATGNTTTVNDCLILIFVGTGSDIDSTTEIGSWTNASLANLTERMDNWNSNGGGFGCATGELATAGTYNATTATLVTAGTKAFCTIAVKPVTGGSITGSASITQAGDSIASASALQIQAASAPTQDANTLSS